MQTFLHRVRPSLHAWLVILALSGPLRLKGEQSGGETPPSATADFVCRFSVDYLPPFQYFTEPLTMSVLFQSDRKACLPLTIELADAQESVYWTRRVPINLDVRPDHAEIVIPAGCLVRAGRLHARIGGRHVAVAFCAADKPLPLLEIADMRLTHASLPVVILLHKRVGKVDRRWAWIKWIHRHWVREPFVPRKVVLIADTLSRNPKVSYVNRLDADTPCRVEVCLADGDAPDALIPHGLVAAWSRRTWQHLDTMVIATASQAYRFGTDPKVLAMGIEVLFHQAKMLGIQYVLLCSPFVPHTFEEQSSPYREALQEVCRQYNHVWLEADRMLDPEYWRMDAEDAILGRYPNEAGHRFLTNYFAQKLEAIVPK